jgi:hypothetical protein
MMIRRRAGALVLGSALVFSWSWSWSGGADAIARRRAAPPARAARAEGTVLSYTAGVSLRPAPASAQGATWREIELGQLLSRRDELRTGPAAVATLDACGGRVWMDPGSQLIVLGAAQKKDQGGLQLVAGALRVATGRTLLAKKQPLRLLLPDGLVLVRGAARVEVAQGSVLLSVYEGIAEVIGQHGTAKVGSGFGAALSRGAAPRLKALPIPARPWKAELPIFFALAQGAPTASGGGGGLELALPLAGTAGATRYLLEVARDPGMTERVHVSDGGGGQAVLPLPGRGRYFARLNVADEEKDRTLGQGRVLPFFLSEVRGERAQAAGQALQGVGALSLELLPPGGKAELELDGQQVAAGAGPVSLLLSRGAHTLRLRAEGGAQGELPVQVAAPRYAIDVAPEEGENREGAGGQDERAYRVRVRPLDEGAPAEMRPRARVLVLGEGGAEPAAGEEVPLQALGSGAFGARVRVAAGQVARLSIEDEKGRLASADLQGPSPPPSQDGSGSPGRRPAAAASR